MTTVEFEICAKNKGVFDVVSLSTSPDTLNSHLFEFGAEDSQPFEVSAVLDSDSSPRSAECS